MSNRLVKGGTGEIVLSALIDEVTGAYQPDATVTGSVTNLAGTALPGLDAIRLVYVTGSSADYQYVVGPAATADVGVGDVVTVSLVATLANGAAMPFVHKVRIIGSGGPP